MIVARIKKTCCSLLCFCSFLCAWSVATNKFWRCSRKEPHHTSPVHIEYANKFKKNFFSSVMSPLLLFFATFDEAFFSFLTSSVRRRRLLRTCVVYFFLHIIEGVGVWKLSQLRVKKLLICEVLIGDYFNNSTVQVDLHSNAIILSQTSFYIHTIQKMCISTKSDKKCKSGKLIVILWHLLIVHLSFPLWRKCIPLVS